MCHYSNPTVFTKQRSDFSSNQRPEKHLRISLLGCDRAESLRWLFMVDSYAQTSILLVVSLYWWPLYFTQRRKQAASDNPVKLLLLG